MNEGKASPSMEFTYNPFLPEIRADPYPVYKRLRETDPIHFNKHAGIWFLTRHEHCNRILRDPRFSAELGQSIRRRHDKLPRSMLSSDPPDHTRLRNPVSKIFPPMVHQLRPRIQEIVDELLGQFAERGRIEIIGDFADPLALRILAEILGVPPKDLERFQDWAHEASINLDPLASPLAQRQSIEATVALVNYFTETLADRRRFPKHDLLTALLSVVDQCNTITTEELVSMCNLVVIGGHEPTVNLIGNGLFTLLSHPDDLRLLREDRSLIKRALEEILRFDSPIQFTARVATQDVEIDGKTIRKGQAAVALLGAANRDPRVFRDPDQLDLVRSPNPHFAFGSGVHSCLGAPLARLAGQIALGTLVHRFPHMQLLTDSPEWRKSIVPRGLKALRVILRE